MVKAIVVAFALAGVAGVCSEKARQVLAWPYRRIQLEYAALYSIDLYGGSVFDREARRQARQDILDSPYTPFKS